MPMYDDPEQLLHDQGLEVVVVPYRPSPLRDKSARSCHPSHSHEAPEFMSHSGPQLVTPRSQLAMVEAVCQGDAGEGNALPLHPLQPRDNDALGSSAHNPMRDISQSEASASNRLTRTPPRRQRPNTNSPLKSPRRNRKLSYIQLVKLGYQELVHAIIRPPRSSYTIDALGPASFEFCNARVTRRDFYIRNERNMKIQCSLWSCHNWSLDESDRTENTVSDDDMFTGRVVMDDWDESKESGRMYLQFNEDVFGDHDLEGNSASSSSLSDEEANGPIGFKRNEYKSSTTSKTNKQRHSIVIYLHGNSSSRVEVIPHLGHLLSLGFSVVSFDFCGSGQSDGDYVSLGYHEREDLDAVIQYMRKTGQVSSIALWGRSMGAATALMYASRDPTIACMILDSPFTDLHRLIQEMVEKGRRQGLVVPNLVLHMVMRLIKNSVKSTAGFSLRHISPISHADKCFVPAMFVAGEHDDFIHKSHSIHIHRKYAGDKNISIVDGDHNSPRPRFLHQSACLFLQNVIGVSTRGELVVPRGMNLMIPPWLLPNQHLRPKSMPLWGDVNSRYHGQTGARRKSEHQSRNKKRCDKIHSIQDIEADAVLASVAPPDMNERQKDIQSSLFKMLGQS